MKIKILLAFVLGISFTSFIGRLVVHVKAQDAGGPIHVCVAQDGVLHVVPYAAGCPPGQRRLVLKRANAAANSEKPKDKTPPDTSLDKAKLEDLNRRLIKLEEMGCAAFGKRRVVAPFEVVDRSGKLIFTVLENKVGLFDGPGTPIAAIVADREGGLFSARGGDVRVIFGINDPRVAGLSVSEHSFQIRIKSLRESERALTTKQDYYLSTTGLESRERSWRLLTMAGDASGL